MLRIGMKRKWFYSAVSLRQREEVPLNLLYLDHLNMAVHLRVLPLLQSVWAIISLVEL